MGGVKVVTGAAAAVLLLVCMGPAPVLADTIEAALVRAYQNNPQLNAQRAAVRATDENVPQALSGYRPKVALTASARLPVHRHQFDPGRHADPARQNRNSRHRPTARRRPHGHADALQRQSDRQQDPGRGKPGFGGARRPARAGAERSALGGHDLHGLSARLRHRRGSAQQHPRARADPEADPGPLQCRRGDPHRRCAVGSAARRRQDPAADRRSQPDDDAVEFPPHHRQRTARNWRRVRRWIASCRARSPPRSNSA